MCVCIFFIKGHQPAPMPNWILDGPLLELLPIRQSSALRYTLKTHHPKRNYKDIQGEWGGSDYQLASYKLLCYPLTLTSTIYILLPLLFVAIVLNILNKKGYKLWNQEILFYFYCGLMESHFGSKVNKNRWHSKIQYYIAVEVLQIEVILMIQNKLAHKLGLQTMQHHNSFFGF